MNARITALRAGRRRALVQRPRRKIHLASIGAGEQAWITFCDRDVLASGATFWTGADAETLADERPDDVCAHCARMLLVAKLITLEFRLDADRLPSTFRTGAAR